MYICVAMGVKRKTEWTEEKIQSILTEYFFNQNSKKYNITNLYVYGWESDYLAVMRSGIVHEVEIKVSRADFKNDVAHKKDKHLLLEGNDMLGRFNKKSGMPNYFYYAVPDGLVQPEEIPEYAGLIYVNPWGVKIVKQGRMLTTEKFDPVKLNIADKFYYNMQNWKEKYETVRDSAEEIKDLKRQIRQFSKDIEFYDERLGEVICENDELKLEIKKWIHLVR